jgi:hypothetical protein
MSLEKQSGADPRIETNNEIKIEVNMSINN